MNVTRWTAALLCLGAFGTNVATAAAVSGTATPGTARAAQYARPFSPTADSAAGPAGAAVQNRSDSADAPSADQGAAPDTTVAQNTVAQNTAEPASEPVSANDLNAPAGAPRAATQASDSGLPFTGQDVGLLAALAMALLASGVLLRRRTRDTL